MTLFPKLSNFLFSPRHRRGLSRFGYLFVRRALQQKLCLINRYLSN